MSSIHNAHAHSQLHTHTHTCVYRFVYLPSNGALFVGYVIVVAFISSPLDLIRVPELAVYLYRRLTSKTRLERESPQQGSWLLSDLALFKHQVLHMSIGMSRLVQGHQSTCTWVWCELLKCRHTPLLLVDFANTVKHMCSSFSAIECVLVERSVVTNDRARESSDELIVYLATKVTIFCRT